MGTWESYRRLHSDEAHPDVLTVVHNLAGMIDYFFLTVFFDTTVLATGISLLCVCVFCFSN